MAERDEQHEGQDVTTEGDPAAIAWAEVIVPLLDMGLRKQRQQSKDEHAAMLRRLARKVSYLDRAQLGGLREAIARMAGGRARNLWPDEVSILNRAADIEAPPARDSRLVSSYLASRAGRSAWEEHPTVAASLRKHLKDTGLPPTKWDWTQIRERAAGWRRWAEELRAREALSEDEAALLGKFDAMIAKVGAIVSGGVSA
ncbi:MAG TPA: hypothetical protein PKA33_01600 [Amaricoccus sp.]|uniref:hypothetical protein n=1 Tax=Amaricoccus sp. TaxID=1872485 RepID=UPI002CF2D328|nr:hypothetical protein [Amaricoccus sp.]HMR51210.1 hypothetical protein [Amaricoccus sp.]HMT98041.1 hypothetical protein [Amaricoccus sp.]